MITVTRVAAVTVRAVRAWARFLSADVVFPSAGAGSVATDPALIHVIVSGADEKTAEEGGRWRGVILILIVGLVFVVNIVLIIRLSRSG
jgi:hypothetical protein